MSLEIKQNLEYSLEGLYKIIYELHNPELIKVDEQPNANTIYHIYNDGEILYQKGGWAYGNKYPFPNFLVDPCKFPIKATNFYGNPVGYAITTLEDCIRIRNYMEML